MRETVVLPVPGAPLIVTIILYRRAKLWYFIGTVFRGIPPATRVRYFMTVSVQVWHSVPEYLRPALVDANFALHIAQRAEANFLLEFLVFMRAPGVL